MATITVTCMPIYESEFIVSGFKFVDRQSNFTWEGAMTSALI